MYGRNERPKRSLGELQSVLRDAIGEYYDWFHWGVRDAGYVLPRWDVVVPPKRHHPAEAVEVIVSALVDLNRMSSDIERAKETGEWPTWVV